MTIQQLIEELNKYPQDMEILIPDGSKWLPIKDLFTAYTTSDGTLCYDKEDAEDKDSDYSLTLQLSN